MNFANLFCDCSISALYFCLTCHPAQYFCHEHKEAHSQKHSPALHEFYPIEADLLFKTIGLEQFKKRLNRVEDTKAVFESRLKEAKEARLTVERKFEEFETALIQRKIDVLTNFDRFLTEAGQQLAEFTAKMTEMRYNFDFIPKTEIEEIGIGKKPIERLLLQSISFEIDQNDAKRLIFHTKSVFNRSIFAISSSVPSIPVLLRSNIYKLSYTGDQPPAVLPITGLNSDFTQSQTCFTGNNERLFACGGVCDPKQAAFINVKTGSGEKLKDMSYKREKDCGLVFVDPFVYVFGGVFGRSTLKSSEKFDINQKKWSSLDSMHVERRGFTPVYYNAKIYLVGGYTTRVECYHINENRFEALECEVPGAGPSVSILIGDRMVIFSGKKLHQYRFGDRRSVELRDCDTATPTTCLPPVYSNDGCVYFVGIAEEREIAALWRYVGKGSAVEKVGEVDLEGRGRGR